jgi:hypothetical protein
MARVYEKALPSFFHPDIAPQKLFPEPAGYGCMVSRAQLVITVIVLAVVAGVAFLLLTPKAPAPAREVVMTGAQFAQEYNLYKVDPPQNGPFEGYYDYPSLAPGDVLKVRDKVAAIGYSNRTGATNVVLSGFEGAPALRDGLFFAGNLTGKYKAGDSVELTFHVVQTTVKYNGTTIAAELLNELNGKSREKSPEGMDSIPATSIRKYG